MCILQTTVDVFEQNSQNLPEKTKTPIYKCSTKCLLYLFYRIFRI